MAFLAVLFLSENRVESWDFIGWYKWCICSKLDFRLVYLVLGSNHKAAEVCNISAANQPKAVVYNVSKTNQNKARKCVKGVYNFLWTNQIQAVVCNFSGAYQLLFSELVWQNNLKANIFKKMCLKSTKCYEITKKDYIIKPYLCFISCDRKSTTPNFFLTNSICEIQLFSWWIYCTSLENAVLWYIISVDCKSCTGIYFKTQVHSYICIK